MQTRQSCVKSQKHRGGKRSSKLPSKVRSIIRSTCSEAYHLLVREAEYTHNTRVDPNGTIITPELLTKFSQQVNGDPLNDVLHRSLANVPLSLLSEDRQVVMNIDYAYSHTMDKYPKATDQYQSGRCWLFAALNAIRYTLIAKFNLQDRFELSEAYLFFYDKLERANHFLEKMIQMRHTDPNDPLFVALLTNCGPRCDGGTWNFFVNLIDIYGVVPKTIYDECFNSMSTEEMNEVLMDKLTDYMQFIRSSSATEKTLRHIKDTEFVPEIYSLLVKFMGEPPQTFEWKYHESGETFESVRDRGTYHLIPSLDAHGFYNTYINNDFQANKKMFLIHDPRPTSKPYTCYIVEHDGNMVGGRPSMHFNMPLDVIKTAVAESLKNKTPVWFACDVMKKYNIYRDLLSVEASNESNVLGVTFMLNKADRLISRSSGPTHAMLLVGVDIEDGTLPRYKKWRVENSWGEFIDSQDPGFLKMSDQWFDEYVYEVVIDPCYLPEDICQQLDEARYTPVTLPFNDPFGAVAHVRTPQKVI